LQKKAHHQHDEEERKEERNKRLRRRKNPAIFVRLNLLIMSDDEPVAILLAGLLTKKLKDALYWPTLAVVLCGMPGNNDKGVRTHTSDIRGWYFHVSRSIYVRWSGFILNERDRMSRCTANVAVVSGTCVGLQRIRCRHCLADR
jgi:hypothetical protein